MARRGLAGGYTEVTFGCGRTLRDEIKAEAKARGWSASEFHRRAGRALLEAIRRRDLVGDGDDEDEYDVDLEDARDDTEAPRTYVTPLGCHRAAPVSLGRWVARYPNEWTDDECVVEIRKHVPDGAVKLHRRDAAGYVLTEAIPAERWRDEDLPYLQRWQVAYRPGEASPAPYGLNAPT